MPAMHPAVDVSWDLIVRWLDEHRDPELIEMEWFTTPATEADIDAVAAEIGGPLPADLVAWWRLAGGGFDPESTVHLLPPGQLPLGPADAIRVRAKCRELMSYEVSPEADATGPAGGETTVFGSQFLPVAWDHGHTNLFVDLRPGPQHGCVMRWDDESAVRGGPLWPSVTAMLADTARALTDGTPALAGRADCVPELDEEAMFWEPAEPA